MNPSPQAVVFRATGCGLANRLRALVGYQSLARLLNVPFYLCWVADPSCEARFEELFDTPLNRIDPPALKSLPDSVIIYREAIWFDQLWRLWAREFPWEDFLVEVRHCLEQLRPCRELSAAVEEFASTHCLAGALGMHIRHTDNLAFYTEWAQQSPDFDCRNVSSPDGFMDAIHTRDAGMPVFLATDDAPLEESFKRIFPEIVTFPKRYRTVGLRPTRIGDALIEMLLLSRCRRIVGTYYSSFSKFSAIWGEVDYLEVRGREFSPDSLVDRALHPAPDYSDSCLLTP